MSQSIQMVNRSKQEPEEDELDPRIVADMEEGSYRNLAEKTFHAPRNTKLSPLHKLGQRFDLYCGQATRSTLAWKLSFNRIIQYIDMVLAITSFAVTIHQDVLYPDLRIRIPFLSIFVVSLSLLLPIGGIIATIRMESVGLLLLLHTGAYASEKEMVQAETVMAILRIIVGIIGIISGYSLFLVLSRLKHNRQTVVIVGLDGSGKSLLLDTVTSKSRLNHGQMRTWEINPTQGMRYVEFFEFESFWKIWDMSGAGQHRFMWEAYFGHMMTIMFVVDASDVNRFMCVQQEFFRIVDSPETKAKRPNIVILLNKTDILDKKHKKRGKIDQEQLSVVLKIREYSKLYRIKMLSSSAILNIGIEDAFYWILEQR